MKKTIQAGPFTLGVDVSDGNVALTAEIGGSLGGGAAAGVVKGKNTTEIDLGAREGADLAIAILEAHFPAATSELEAIKTFVEGKLA